MSTIQRVAQIFGWVFVVVAVWGFIVSGGSMDADPATAPKVLGLFPVNLLHNLVHLAFGVWGILAARSVSGAKSYALGAGVIYLVLTIFAFLTPTTFGLIPIGGNDIWLHAIIAVALLGAWATARSATAAPVAGAATTAPPAGAPASPEPRTPPPGATQATEPARGIGTSPGGTPGAAAPDRPAASPPPPPRPPSSGEGDRRP